MTDSLADHIANGALLHIDEERAAAPVVPAAVGRLPCLGDLDHEVRALLAVRPDPAHRPHRMHFNSADGPGPAVDQQSRAFMAIEAQRLGVGIGNVRIVH